MADTHRKDQEDQECPICYESLTGSLFTQPICGHSYHEKCWNQHLLTYKGDPVRCQRCLQPVDQKAVRWLLDELSRLGPELPLAANRAEVEELLSQLVALGESGLLEDEGVTRATLIVEGSIRTTAHAVLFAHYMSSLLAKVGRCTETFNREMTIEQLPLLASPGFFVQLAALIWGQEPEAAARFPCIKHLLWLESGTSEAHHFLGRLLTGQDFASARWGGQWQNDEIFRDLDWAEHHLFQAWRQRDLDAGASLAKLLADRGKDDESVQVCRQLTQLLSANREHAEVNHRLGKLYMKRGDLEGAELHLRRAFDVGECEPLIDLGRAFQERGDLNKAKCCFWDVHNCTGFKVKELQMKDIAREELARLLFQEGAREESLRLALIKAVAVALQNARDDTTVRRNSARLRDSLYWEPAIAALHEFDSNCAVLLVEVELYFQLGCHELTEEMVRALCWENTDMLFALGWGCEEQGQLRKAARCYRKCQLLTPLFPGEEWYRVRFASVRVAAWMSTLHLRWELQDPRAPQEIANVKAQISEGGPTVEALKKILDELEAMSFKKAIPQSIKALFFEDAVPLQQVPRAEEPIPLPDKVDGAAAANPPQEPTRTAPPCTATPSAPERDPFLPPVATGQLRAPRPLPLEMLDDQDPEFQTALLLSCTEQQDPLLAVRTNPVLMRAQQQLLLQPVHHLPDVEEQVQEELFLLQFKRSSPESWQRLHFGELLRPCREALEEAGCPWLFDWGVKIFVHPCQYDLAKRLLLQHVPGGLFPRHVVVSSSFLPLVREALAGCPAGAGKMKAMVKLGDVPVPAESEEPETESILSSMGQQVPQLQAERQSRDQGAPQAVRESVLSSEGKQQVQRQVEMQSQPFHGAPQAERETVLSSGGQQVSPQVEMPIRGAAGAQEPETEGLFLLHFQRSSKDFENRLRFAARLQPCRRALEAAGCPWLLTEEEVHRGHLGVKVFVRPVQYHQALQLLRQHQAHVLFSRHVLVSESFLPLVLEALQGCTGGGGTLKQRDGQVRIGELSLRLDVLIKEAGMEMRGSTLTTQHKHYRHRVIKSTGTASNPRRCKPNFQALSLSESSVVNEVTRDDAMNTQAGAPIMGSDKSVEDNQGQNDHPRGHGEGPHGADDAKSTENFQAETREVGQGPLRGAQVPRGPRDLFEGLRAAPPGLALAESHGFSVLRTFFDVSPKRRQKQVAASTRTCKSNPRCRSVGSEAE